MIVDLEERAAQLGLRGAPNQEMEALRIAYFVRDR